MTRALLLSGGVGHDCPTTSRLLAQAIAPAGVECEVTEDLDAGFARLRAFDLLVVNALRWPMAVERYAPMRPQWEYHLPEDGKRAIAGHVTAGKPVLAVHTSVICFDDWPGWGEILGARWDWERSYHPPIAEASIAVATDAHPIVAGLGDFQTVDEIYTDLIIAPDVQPLATSHQGGADQPLLWARTLPGSGARVVVDLLAHDERGYAPETHQAVLRGAAAWLQGVHDA